MALSTVVRLSPSIEVTDGLDKLFKDKDLSAAPTILETLLAESKTTENKLASLRGRKFANEIKTTSSQLYKRIDTIHEKLQSIHEKLTNSDTVVSSPAREMAHHTHVVREGSRLQHYLGWVVQIHKFNDIITASKTEDERIQAFAQLAQINRRLSSSNCHHLKTMVEKCTSTWQTKLSHNQLTELKDLLSNMKEIYTPSGTITQAGASPSAKQLLSFETIVQSLHEFDVGGANDIPTSLRIILEPLAHRFQYHHLSKDTKATDANLKSAYEIILSDFNIWCEGHTPLLQRIQKCIDEDYQASNTKSTQPTSTTTTAPATATSTTTAATTTSSIPPSTTTATATTPSSFNASPKQNITASFVNALMALFAQRVNRDVDALMCEPMTEVKGVRLCELARACLQVDEDMSHVCTPHRITHAWEAFTAQPRTEQVWLLAERAMLLDKLDEIVDLEASWKTPPLLHLDPVKAFKGADSVLAISEAVTKLCALSHDPAVHWGLVALLAEVFSGFLQEIRNVANAASDDLAGNDLMAQYCLLFNTVWYMRKSIDVLAEDPTYVMIQGRKPESVKSHALELDAGDGDSAMAGLDLSATVSEIFSDQADAYKTIETKAHNKLLDMVTQSYLSQVENYALDITLSENTTAGQELNHMFAKGAMVLLTSLTTLKRYLGEECMTHLLGDVAATLASRIMMDVIGNLSSLDEASATQLHFDIVNGLLEPFVPFVDKPSQLFPKVLDLCTLVTLDTAQWSRLHGLFTMGDELIKDQREELLKMGVLHLNVEDVRAALELRHDFMHEVAPY